MTFRSSNRSILSLELKDAEHVRRVASVIDPELPVYDYKRPDGRTSAKLVIYRGSIVKDCVAKGLVPAKTAILQWPSDLPEALESHFVRGYFDGDGTVSESIVKNSSGYTTKLRTLAFACGSDDFAQSLHTIIQQRTGASGKIWHPVETCASVSFNRKDDIRAIGELMYADGDLHLPRKYQKWQEVILAYESDPTTRPTASHSITL
ncbi:MAG: LAGLIDADG family homing endonuclease [Chloroflexota bacterium]